jgi:hypothetical protein
MHKDLARGLQYAVLAIAIKVSPEFTTSIVLFCALVTISEYVLDGKKEPKATKEEVAVRSVFKPRHAK